MARLSEPASKKRLLPGQNRFSCVAALAAPLLILAACEDPMANQPHHEALEMSTFYSDGRASRLPPAGAVALGEIELDKYRTDLRREGDPLPIEISMETLERGRERYEINCMVCHGGTGDGQGIVPARGYSTPTSYHIDRLRSAPLDHFVKVIEKGAGRMPSYAGQVEPRDRWAIALYIRALQLSQNAPAELLSADDLRSLAESQRGGATGAGEAETQP